jgi:hypothetical protein
MPGKPIRDPDGNPYSPEAWARLGERLQLRYWELGGGKSLDEWVKGRGISRKTLGEAMYGWRDTFTRALLRLEIDRVMQWEQGSCERILQGLEPVPLSEEAVPAEPLPAWVAEIFVDAPVPENILILWDARDQDDQLYPRAVRERLVRDYIRRNVPGVNHSDGNRDRKRA